ncbi:hypothetical protein [Candidatus Poriferisodalis sp.]|uniref:hypothetical protein n=1 Tax=Candidatus Poriferisodalis sp. TaxID=3101277 RepID=UPI003B019187
MSSIWPVYAGKSFNLWRPDTGDYYDSVDAEAITGHLQEKRKRQNKVKSSAFAHFDQDHLADPGTLACLRARIAFRRVARTTDTRTFVCSLIPPRRIATEAASYFEQIRGEIRDEAYVLGILSSMIFDWQLRRVMELTLSFTDLMGTSIADPGSGHPVRDRVVEIAGRLAAVDERFEQWAAEVGVPVGSANDEATKTDLIHELDACVAHLYGLDEYDLEVIYTTFDEKRPDRYRDRLAAVLDHFRGLPNSG